jgi:hypothetical protein
VIHSGWRAEYDAVLYLDEAPPSHGFAPLRITPLGQRHPPRLGCGACGLPARALHPLATVRHDGREVLRVASTQKPRHTAWRSHLSEGMEPSVRHRQGAFTDLDAQQHCGLRIDGGPHPGGGTARAAQWPRRH